MVVPADLLWVVAVVLQMAELLAELRVVSSTIAVHPGMRGHDVPVGEAKVAQNCAAEENATAEDDVYGGSVRATAHTTATTTIATRSLEAIAGENGRGLILWHVPVAMVRDRGHSDR